MPRYLGNVRKKEVHDLDNEQTNCQINEIIEPIQFPPHLTLDQIHDQGYDNCAWCIGDSRR